MTILGLRDTDPQSNIAGVSFWRGIRVTHSTPSGTYTIATVPEGCIVIDVLSVVTEAFDGTGVAGRVGDGDDDDGYMDGAAGTGDIALATSGIVVTAPLIKRLATGLSAQYVSGKRYPSGDTIDFVFVNSTSGTPTTGSVDLLVQILSVKELGIPAANASTAVPI